MFEGGGVSGQNWWRQAAVFPDVRGNVHGLQSLYFVPLHYSKFSGGTDKRRSGCGMFT